MNFDMRILRSISSLASRSIWSGMFNGKRDMDGALGYQKDLTSEDYDRRYRRGDISKALVDIFPQNTWATGIEVVETDNPHNDTEFEVETAKLIERLNLWSVFLRADILCGLDTYSVVLIGAKGSLDSPLKPGKSQEDILYLTPYRKVNAVVESLITDSSNPKYGHPEYYQLKNLDPKLNAGPKPPRVHHSRIIHIAYGLDTLFDGPPVLESIWNRLDDLDKTIGGGSEGFWKVVYQGMQIDVDKDMDLDETAKEELQEQIDEFEHNIRRVFRTRGVKVNPLGSETVDFSPQADKILETIAAAKRIPKKILLGTERGELASKQDADAWSDTINDRRSQFAWPIVVKPFFDRLIELSYLPKPESYHMWWPEKNKMTMMDKAVVAQRLSSLNKNMQAPVVSPSDLRDKVFGWEKLFPEDLAEVPPETYKASPRVPGPPPAAQPNKTQQSQGDVVDE